MKFGTHFRRYPTRMRLPNFLLISGLFFLSLSAFAQVPSTDTTRSAPTRRAVPRDSVNIVPGNVDSLERAPVPVVQAKYNPRQITRRSMIIPGWGQVTMKQYWAPPIIYGGFAALLVAVQWNNSRLGDWNKAYRVVGEQVYPAPGSGITPNPNAEYEINGVSYRFVQIQGTRKILLRNRDMSFIGMAFLYGLNVVQANVSAHLKTFDETDDISLRLSPGSFGSFGIVPFGATLTLSFSSKPLRD